MTPLSREEVMAVLGPVDDILVARIIATGASYSDLAEAHAWIAADDTLMDTGQKLPTGLAGELVAILSRIEEEEDESPA